MTLRCSVRGCQTGSYADKQKNRRSGIKQTTVFCTPRCPDLLEEWNAALNQKLTEKDKVCELHFRDEDILRTDDTRMPDGTIFSLPRMKYSLRKNVVPINVGNQENEEPEHNEIRTSEESIKMEIKSEATDILTSDFEPYFETETDEAATYATLNSNCMQGSPLNNHYYIMDKNELDETGKQMESCDENLKQTSQDDVNTVKTKNTQENYCGEYIKCERNSLDGQNDSTSPFTISNIIVYLQKNPLPRTWSWMLCTRYDSGITFTQIECFTRNIRCYVELHEDLTVTIQTADEQIKIDIEFEISTTNSVIKALETVERLRICSGPGIGSESRHKDCTGIATPDEELKVNKHCYRCIACRKLRKSIQSRHCYGGSDLNSKYKHAKKEINFLRRKYKLAEEQLNLKNKKLKTLTEMIIAKNKYNIKEI